MLIKDAEALERLAKVDTLVVDKTGTLTEGKPQLVAVVAADGFDEATICSALGRQPRTGERASARRRDRRCGASERGVELAEARRISTSVTGKGVTGTVDGRAVALGNAGADGRSRRRHGAVWRRAPMRCARDGATVMFVAVDGKPAGLLAVADPIKATTPAALARAARGRHRASSC